jgi:hypothetical protein
MNSLYTSGVRQTSSLQADLERLRNGDATASLLGTYQYLPSVQLFSRAYCLLGQISASFAAMHRTIDDYDSMAKREIIKAKQEKAQMSATCVFLSIAISNPIVHRRIQKFRADYAELRSQFDTLKKEASAEVTLPFFFSFHTTDSVCISHRMQHHSEPNSFPHLQHSHLPQTPAVDSKLHNHSSRRCTRAYGHSPKNTRNPRSVAQHLMPASAAENAGPLTNILSSRTQMAV